MPIYLDTSHTARTNARTGIQTVVRGLVAALSSQNHEVVPLRWSFRKRCLTLLKPQWQENLQHSVAVDTWLPWKSLLHPPSWPAWTASGGLSYRTPIHRHPVHAKQLQGSWCVLPELMEGQHVRAVADYARSRGLRVAAIFHDAIAWLKPDMVRHWSREQHQDYMKALTHLDAIIAVSYESARHFHEIAAELQWSHPPVRVCTLPAQVVGQERARSEAKSSSEPLRLLCVSTLEPRKNHPRLLNAFGQARARCSQKLELHLVGAAYDAAPEIAHTMRKLVAENDGLFWHPRASASELHQFYRDCDFTIFGSWIEGFGMPVMESLWFAKPCLCADRGVMAENAAGGGCLTVDMQNTGAIADGILGLCDPAFRQELGKQAAERELKTWSQYGAEIWQQLREI